VEQHEIYISMSQVIAMMGILITSGLSCIGIAIGTAVNINRKFNKNKKKEDFDVLAVRTKVIEDNYIKNITCDERMHSLKEHADDGHKRHTDQFIKDQKFVVEVAQSLSNRDKDNEIKIINLENEVRDLEKQHIARTASHLGC